MAETFQVQVEDLTGSVSDTAALSSWLTDGARTVLNILPIDKLARVASNTNFTNTQDVEGRIIISVLRRDENNSGAAMPCRPLPPSMMGKVGDSSYMEAATTSDPAYIIFDELLNIYPTVVSSNHSRLIAIKTDITVLYSASSIDNFPDEAEPAVVLYAARNGIQRLMNDVNVSLSDLSISTTVPVVPTLTTVSYSDATNADASASAVSSILVSSISDVDPSNEVPTYTKPTLSLSSVAISDLSISASAPTALDISAPSVSFSASTPNFVPPTLSVDTSQFETFLETDEDTELAQLQLGRLNNEVQQYQSNIQKEVANFNKDVIVYQAELQKAIKNAELTSASEAQQMQEYSNDIQLYSQNVNKEVQEYQQNTQKELSLYQAKTSVELKQYSQDIQNELHEFNKENVRYQAEMQDEVSKHNTALQLAITQAQLDAADAQLESQQTTSVDVANKAADQALALQNSSQNMTAAIQDNNALMSKYGGELQAYGSNVNKEVQEYGSNLQKDTAQYTWYAQQYQMLDSQYKEQIQFLTGLSSPQQQR